jgi:hypothetical protein
MLRLPAAIAAVAVCSGAGEACRSADGAPCSLCGQVLLRSIELRSKQPFRLQPLGAVLCTSGRNGRGQRCALLISRAAQRSAEASHLGLGCICGLARILGCGREPGARALHLPDERAEPDAGAAFAELARVAIGIGIAAVAANATARTSAIASG